MKRLWLLCGGLVWTAAQADSGLDELSVTQSFQLSATVIPGCLLGSGGSDSSSFGSLDFGQLGNLDSDMQLTSSLGAGSIVLQCTPGTALSIALDSGSYSSDVSAGRFLGKGSERLRYQIYQDAGNTTVWGDSGNGGMRMDISFPLSGGVQSYPLYARLFGVSPLPSAGIYSDTVTVTINY